jgi:hypothetical protein
MNTLNQFYYQIKKELKEELKKEFEEKLLKLENELNNVRHVLEKRNELFYQKQLEKLLNGTHKTTKHGITDIFTNDAIYEIKCWKNYKSCFGQLKSYYLGNEDKRLCAAFYGETNEQQKEKIIDLFSHNKIEVYEIKETCDGVIYLQKLNKLVENNKESDFYKWLDENIVYYPSLGNKENNILKLSETVSLYLGEKISSRQLGNYRKEIEKYIKDKFNNVDFEYKQFWINDIKYKGWKNLGILSKQITINSPNLDNN